ncbi:MAG: glycerophosphodiester phosphodiesterase [Pseudobacteriovorax sp.]|nr:glycerophosphodiester phosphodiesterase [Pseudobacteriovorax sp.]
MIIVGHRGNPFSELENSMAGFRSAIALGISRIECDIQATQDNLPIIMHDYDLGRTCPSNATISSQKAETLLEIRLNNGERLPSLQDVIQHVCPFIEVNLEIKPTKKPIVHAILDQVPPIEDRPFQIIFSSFEKSILSELREKAPAESIAFLADKDYNLSEVVRDMDTLNCGIFHPHVDLLCEDLTLQARSRDWQIIPFIGIDQETEHKKDIWQRLIQHKVDGFCTNFPQEYKNWLINEGIIT